MKVIVTILHTDLSLFCPFLETENKNKGFSKLVVW